MADEYISFTPIRSYFETAGERYLLSRKKLAETSQIGHCIENSGIHGMERLNSLSKSEIMAISGITKKDYPCIKETLDLFRVEYSNQTWEMPHFNDFELGYIYHLAIYRKRTNYYDIAMAFFQLADERNRHPLRDILFFIHTKLISITRDEFLTIVAKKNYCTHGIEIA